MNDYDLDATHDLDTDYDFGATPDCDTPGVTSADDGWDDSAAPPEQTGWLPREVSAMQAIWDETDHIDLDELPFGSSCPAAPHRVEDRDD